MDPAAYQSSFVSSAKAACFSLQQAESNVRASQYMAERLALIVHEAEKLKQDQLAHKIRHLETLLVVVQSASEFGAMFRASSVTMKLRRVALSRSDKVKIAELHARISSATEAIGFTVPFDKERYARDIAADLLIEDELVRQLAHQDSDQPSLGDEEYKGALAAATLEIEGKRRRDDASSSDLASTTPSHTHHLWFVDHNEVKYDSSSPRGRVLIGSGRFGVVYAGHYRHKKVAVTELTPTLASDSGALDKFKEEMRLMLRLSHPYIAPFFGGWDDLVPGDVYPSALTEYHDWRLADALYPKDDVDPEGIPTMKTPNRLLIVLQIAEAMCYLHSGHPVIENLTITPEHVLLLDTENIHIRLIGFGLNLLTPFISRDRTAKTLRYSVRHAINHCRYQLCHVYLFAR
jgi:hypothetical protein